MLDLHSYFKANLGKFPSIRGVYRSTGLTRMEELLRDVEATEFPCIMVDIGVDGWLDVLSSDNCTSSQTFYVLGDPAAGDIDAIADTLRAAFATGKAIIRGMRVDGRDYGAQCYGIEFSRIDFIKVGPIGLGAYGYGFILNIIEQ